MIKKILYYLFILLIIFIIAIISVFVFKQVLDFFSIQNKIKISENYIINIKKEQGLYPNFCPGSAIAYSEKYNIDINGFFPLGGIPNGNLKIKNDADDRTIKLDEFGFRNSNDVWKNNNIDTAILGDSIVYASDIRNDQLFSNIMNSNDKSVINLGCGGNGLFTSLALLENLVDKYSVNNILIFINMQNDLGKDITTEGKSIHYKKYINNEDFISIFNNKELYKNDINILMINVLKAQINKNKDEIKIRNLFSYKKFQNFIKIFYIKVFTYINKNNIVEEKMRLDYMHSETATYPENYAYFRNFLNNIKRISKLHKIKVTYVLIPSMYRLNAPDITVARTPIKYSIARNKILTSIAIDAYEVEIINNNYNITELD